MDSSIRVWILIGLIAGLAGCTDTTTGPAPPAGGLAPDVHATGSVITSVTSAVLGGTVNPEAFSTSYHFEYGGTLAYGFSTPNQDAGSGALAVKVSAAITNLTPAATYHWRLVASNSGGTSASPDSTFITGNDMSFVIPVGTTWTYRHTYLYYVYGQETLSAGTRVWVVQSSTGRLDTLTYSIAEVTTDTMTWKPKTHPDSLSTILRTTSIMVNPTSIFVDPYTWAPRFQLVSGDTMSVNVQYGLGSRFMTWVKNVGLVHYLGYYYFGHSIYGTEEMTLISKSK